jgi:DNA-binding response OmpR family regulator
MPARVPIDLIVLDLRMPRMDGMAFARHYHERTAARTAPIILLSAIAPQRPPEAGAAIRAATTLAKPCDLDQLLFTVNACWAASSNRSSTRTRIRGTRHKRLGVAGEST